MSTYPVLDFPDSVTHWTCPQAPSPGTTHHMLGSKNVCLYCHQDAAKLREQQSLLRSHWKTATHRDPHSLPGKPTPSLKKWLEDNGDEWQDGAASTFNDPERNST